jgi:uncharacterized protein (TIGR02246 family)
VAPSSNLDSSKLDPLQVAEKLASGFVESWNHHDMASFAELFHGDASFVNVIGKLMKGREEIELHHAAAHSGPFRTSILQIQVEDAREIVPGIVVAHIRSSLHGDARDPGGERQTLLTFILELRGELWRIVAAQNTNIPSTSS